MSFTKSFYLRSKLLIGILFLISALIRGQTVNPDSALQMIVEELEGSPITLTEAVDLAKKNSTAIGKVEALFMAAEGNLKRQRGYFDPEFYFNLYYHDLDIPTSSFFAGANVLQTKETTSQTTFLYPFGFFQPFLLHALCRLCQRPA